MKCWVREMYKFRRSEMREIQLLPCKKTFFFLKSIVLTKRNWWPLKGLKALKAANQDDAEDVGRMSDGGNTERGGGNRG